MDTPDRFDRYAATVGAYADAGPGPVTALAAILRALDPAELTLEEVARAIALGLISPNELAAVTREAIEKDRGLYSVSHAQRWRWAATLLAAAAEAADARAGHSSTTAAFA